MGTPEKMHYALGKDPQFNGLIWPYVVSQGRSLRLDEVESTVHKDSTELI
jgi:hypothetical protein